MVRKALCGTVLLLAVALEAHAGVCAHRGLRSGVPPFGRVYEVGRPYRAVTASDDAVLASRQELVGLRLESSSPAGASMTLSGS